VKVAMRMIEPGSQTSAAPAPAPVLPVLLTVEEVGAWVQMSPSTVRTMAATGRIPACEVGRERRFERDALPARLREDPSSRR
jgi:excisionase family DNA binding protein